jgi:RNA polymerase sigma-70 factor (ECF subfamily)
MTGEAIAIHAPAEAARDDPGGAERLGLLFDLHHQRLYRLARRLAGSAEDARDVVQETFLRAARAPASVPVGAPHEEAWLVRVLINVCRDRWRKAAVRSRVHADPTLGRSAPPSDAEAALVARSMVHHALGRLSPRRRAVIVLYELEGAGIPAIARMLGVTPVTVRWHLSIGRRELAKALAGGREDAS